MCYFPIAVPPSVAEVKRKPSNGSSPRITLYCTSSAIPPPELVWTIEGRMVRLLDNAHYCKDLSVMRSSLSRHLARPIFKATGPVVLWFKH